MWSLSSTTSDPHSTPTADTLHLHLGIHVQLQSADWFTRALTHLGLRVKVEFSIFIKLIKFSDQKHIWVVSCCQGLAESQGQPLSYSGEQRPPESWRQGGLSCWRTVLRGAAHISPQVPEHEEVSPPSVFVLPSELSLPSQQRHQQFSWHIICWLIIICKKIKTTQTRIKWKLEEHGSTWEVRTHHNTPTYRSSSRS